MLKTAQPKFFKKTYLDLQIKKFIISKYERIIEPKKYITISAKG